MSALSYGIVRLRVEGNGGGGGGRNESGVRKTKMQAPPVLITVNGEIREQLTLATGEPIPNLNVLALIYDGENHGPRMLASSTDYREGAYRFAARLMAGPPGVYRARAVHIMYIDGTSAEVELTDTIIVDVEAIHKTPDHVPVFTAR